MDGWSSFSLWLTSRQRSTTTVTVVTANKGLTLKMIVLQCMISMKFNVQGAVCVLRDYFPLQRIHRDAITSPYQANRDLQRGTDSEI